MRQVYANVANECAHDYSKHISALGPSTCIRFRLKTQLFSRLLVQNVMIGFRLQLYYFYLDNQGITGLAAVCTQNTIYEEPNLWRLQAHAERTFNFKFIRSRSTKIAKDYFIRHLYLQQTEDTKGLDKVIKSPAEHCYIGNFRTF